MLAQVTISLIHQQHRRRPRCVTGRHIVNAISDLEQEERLDLRGSTWDCGIPIAASTYHDQVLRAVRQPPLSGNVQDASWIGLGQQIGSITSDNGEKDVGGEMVLDEILDRGSEDRPSSKKTVRRPGSIIQLTQSCVYKVLVSVRGIAGNPLALGDLVEAVAPAWRGVRRPGPWPRLRHGLLVWEDRGCGGGCRLTCQCRGHFWKTIRIKMHLSLGIWIWDGVARGGISWSAGYRKRTPI